jgi:hypothetical protein
MQQPSRVCNESKRTEQVPSFASHFPEPSFLQLGAVSAHGLSSYCTTAGCMRSQTLALPLTFYKPHQAHAMHTSAKAHKLHSGEAGTHPYDSVAALQPSIVCKETRRTEQEPSLSLHTPLPSFLQKGAFLAHGLSVNMHMPTDPQCPGCCLPAGALPMQCVSRHGTLQCRFGWQWHNVNAARQAQQQVPERTERRRLVGTVLGVDAARRIVRLLWLALVVRARLLHHADRAEQSVALQCNSPVSYIDPRLQVCRKRHEPGPGSYMRLGQHCAQTNGRWHLQVSCSCGARTLSSHLLSLGVPTHSPASLQTSSVQPKPSSHDSPGIVIFVLT